MASEQQVNLAVALVDRFQRMSEFQKFQFAGALLKCDCPCCQTMKEIMSANLFAEVFNKGNS